MCLSTITQTIDKPTLNEVTVWKSFAVDYNGGNKPLALQTQQDHKVRAAGVWLKAKRIKISSDEIAYTTCPACQHSSSKYKHYLTGFHGYKRKGDVRHMSVLIPVKFRKVRTIGIQYGYPTLVADEMMIPKNWKKYIK